MLQSNMRLAVIELFAVSRYFFLYQVMLEFGQAWLVVFCGPPGGYLVAGRDGSRDPDHT
ncbi:hypothetical protein D9M71_654960 [compost metagenome]